MKESYNNFSIINFFNYQHKNLDTVKNQTLSTHCEGETLLNQQYSERTFAILKFNITMRTFLHYLIVSSAILFFSMKSFAQSAGDWSAEYVKPKSFITNVGQFDQAAGLIKLEDVEYAYDGTNQMYFFTKAGLVIELSTKH